MNNCQDCQVIAVKYVLIVVSSLDFTYLIDSRWRIVSESSSRRKRNTLL